MVHLSTLFTTILGFVSVAVQVQAVPISSRAAVQKGTRSDIGPDFIRGSIFRRDEGHEDEPLTGGSSSNSAAAVPVAVPVASPGTELTGDEDDSLTGGSPSDPAAAAIPVAVSANSDGELTGDEDDALTADPTGASTPAQPVAVGTDAPAGELAGDEDDVLIPGGGSDAPPSTGSASGSVPVETAATTSTSAAASATSTSTAAAAPPAGAGVGAGVVPPPGAKPFTLANGQLAQSENKRFKTLKETDPCKDGEQACTEGKFSQCVGGKFLATPCSAPTICLALPLVNKAGATLTCTTEADALARIEATGAKGGVDGTSS